MKNTYLCSVEKSNTDMTIAEKKRRMAENFAINSKKTPRTSRMRYAVAHKGAIIVNSNELKERLTTYVDQGLDLIEY